MKQKYVSVPELKQTLTRLLFTFVVLEKPQKLEKPKISFQLTETTVYACVSNCKLGEDLGFWALLGATTESESKVQSIEELFQYHNHDKTKKIE